MTTLGAIEIQMLMDVARFRQTVVDSGQALDQGLARMKSNIAGVLGGLTAGLGVAAFAGMIKGSIDAAEALHDLKMQTGASVESLSAMVAVGRTTGTTAETIGAAMNKLGKNLAVANEDSKGVGQAIQALGLNLDDLRKMKPDDQMRSLAAAMNKFEDGSSKSAVAMTLLGKEGAKLLPYMKDLADAGVLVATVTTEQAAAADEYNDSVTRSRMKTEAFNRTLALDLLPVMAGVHDVTGALGQQMGDYLSASVSTATSRFDAMGVVIRIVGTVLESAVLLGSDVAHILKGIGTDIGGMAAQAAALARGDFAGVKAIHDEMVADAAVRLAELEKFQSKVAGTTTRVLEARDALRNHSVSTAENNREIASLGLRYGQTRKAVLDFKAAGEAAGKAQRDTTKALLDTYAKMADATAVKIIEGQAEIDTDRKLTDAQKDYIKVMVSVRDGKVTLAQLERAGTLDKLKANMVTDEALRLSKEEAQWMAESLKANVAAQDAMAKTTEGLRDQVAKQREANEVIGLNAEQLAAREAATLRDTAAALDNKAAWAEDVDWTGKMSAELRAQAQARRDLADQIGKGVVLKEAQAAADEWKKTTDSIQNGLADALMRGFESGQGFASSFGDFLKNTFKTLVLKPMVDAMVKDISGGLGGVMGSIGSFMGTSGASGAAGAAGGAAGAGGQAVGAGASWLSWVGWAVAALKQGSSEYDAGWTAEVGARAKDNILGKDAIGQSFSKFSVDSVLTKFGKSLGMSDKWASILSGATAVAQLIGRKPAEATAQGITGSFGAGGFVGNQFMDWTAKGGWFRSDKAGTNTSALDDTLGASLNSSAQELLQQTTAYANALALPVTGLVNVTTSARVLLGDDASKNAAAIADALAVYGSDLVKGYEAALQGVSEPGEAAADTLARIGQALLTVNATFEALGLHLVRTSVAGGAAASELVQLTGGLDAFLAKTQTYLGSYFTQTEQLGLGAGGVLRTLKDAGIDFSGATSRGDLRSRLEGLDPNTTSGREQMSALLTVAGDFAKLTDYLAANSLTLGDLASQAPVVGLLVDDPATRSATAGEQSAALLQTSNDRLSDIAGATQNSAAQLQALVALQAAANQALLAQLQSLQQATEDAARLVDLAPVYETSTGA